MKIFIKKNINITIVSLLMSIIIGLLAYINNQNIKSQALNRVAMDKLIKNTTLLKENDIKQDIMIVLNKNDISEMQSDIEKMQNKYRNNKLLTSKY